MPSKYPYDELERQFVHGRMSMRQLARDNGIASWSTLSEYAKRHAWAERRAAYQARLTEAETRTLVERRADQLGKALDDAVTVASQAIWAFLDSLRDRWVTDEETGRRVLVPAQAIDAAGFVRIMEKLMVLNGQATSREARLSLTGEVPSELTMEMLRDLAAAARERGADARPEQRSPLPRLEGARQVN